MTDGVESGAKGASERTATLAAFWQVVVKLDRSKINTWIAFRNTIAVAIPLGVGLALQEPLGAVAVASGALNVSYSDGYDPYAQRARRMLAWSMLGAVAVFVGSVTGAVSWLAVLVAVCWAFGAGLASSVSTRAGDLGLNTLVTCIIYGARGALSPKGAFYAALLFLLGGFIQMAFALVLWPIRRHDPERQAIGQVYAELAQELAGSARDAVKWLPLTIPSARVQEATLSLGQDGSVEGERLRMLFDQADRVRLSTFRLRRLSSEIYAEFDEASGEDPSQVAAETVLQLCPRILSDAAHALITNQPTPANEDDPLHRLELLIERTHQGTGASPIRPDISAAIDVLAGQLRLVSQLASNATTSGETAFLEAQEKHSWRLRIGGWLGTMWANLDRHSSFFRHAVRVAACVAIGDGVGRIFSWQRTYWIPMTIAVVLKPDFASTFSRGLLRLSGTFAGLLVATLLYHVFPPSLLSDVLLVGVFTLLLRSLGPANYGLFTVAVSGLVVFLIAVTGISPKEVVAERALSTAVGGAFALLAYAAWPTWERTTVRESMAVLLDAINAYWQAIAHASAAGGLTSDSELDSYRLACRRARSDAETSVGRLATEPGSSQSQASKLTSMLASSRALMQSLISLEIGLIHLESKTLPPAFETFAHHVEFTLYFLSSALRGSAQAHAVLPQLRQDHTNMLKPESTIPIHDRFLLVETDRMTVSINTLREQALDYLDQTPALTRTRPADAAVAT
jgi:uncharacterized membrane protein YccC